MFGDPLAYTEPDEQYPDRWCTTGDAMGKLLVVIHTDTEEIDDKKETLTYIRLISARLATNQERKAYQAQP